MCYAALCAPCTWAPLRFVTWGAISSALPLPLNWQQWEKVKGHTTRHLYGCHDNQHDTITDKAGQVIHFVFRTTILQLSNITQPTMRRHYQPLFNNLRTHSNNIHKQLTDRRQNTQECLLITQQVSKGFPREAIVSKKSAWSRGWHDSKSTTFYNITHQCQGNVPGASNPTQTQAQGPRFPKFFTPMICMLRPYNLQLPKLSRTYMPRQRILVVYSTSPPKGCSLNAP